MFSPPKDYDYETIKTPLKEFHDYKEKFITRPPYQRKRNVWDVEKKLSFLDSLCRGYYIPPLVFRQVRMTTDTIKLEVIDGQQRISTIQDFYENELKLPNTLNTMSRGNLMVGKTYEKLEVEQKQWFDKIVLEVDVIKNIEDKANPNHLRKASDIFWRLQQGEPLTFMEIQHARINSAVRNFVTKYADDDFFSISDYKFLSKNPNRSPFFEKLLTMKNKRMHHLLLLSRLLLLELKDEPTEISLPQIGEMFESHLISAETIEDSSFENSAEAKRCLTLLNLFYEIFKDDPMVISGGVQELKVEYFIISLYLLLRHLHSNYVFGKEQYPLFKEFVTDFYQRWKKDDSEDSLMVSFRDHRRHHKDDLETRDQIIREIFFTKYPHLLRKDDKRVFNEAERIAIYRKGKGLCIMCQKQGKTEKEALVPWKEYNADHIIAHTKGGITLPTNAQVLCKHHNVQKGCK